MSKRDKTSKNDECVKVAVRCRPLNDDELADGKKAIVDVSSQRGEISIRANLNNPPKTFAFDNVYDWNAKQETIYQETAFPIVDSVLEGYNGTIFAYGQTGTGKTHTMEGKSESKELRGIIPRAFEQIFKQIEGTPNKQFLVRVSFLEIYNEEIRDLLAPNTKNKLDLHLHKEGGFYVKDLISFPVQSVEEMHKKLELGSKSRATAETAMNKGSSRSHSIFTITVEASEIGPDGQNHIRMGKLNLVDLAGSERQSKTKTTGSEFTEAVNINQSLTILGNVISALVSTKTMHIPYRESKLTMLLQDSLGGNTKTVMIANIGPADWNSEETETTLRYAHRAKNIKNKPKINEDPKDAMLREFQDEITKLRAQLEQFSGGKIMGNTGVIGGEKIIRVENEEKMKEIEARLAKEKEELMIKAEEERKRIEAQKNKTEEEKEKLLQNLQEQIESQKKAQEEQSKLLNKLGAMEKKVIKGKKALEQAIKQEKENKKIREELEMKKKKERELEEELQKREVENILKEEKFKNQEDEIKDKKNKLHKLFKKFQETKNEIHEQQEEFNRERESYQEQLYELAQQLKLKNLIISHFIPLYEVQKIEIRSVWSDELDDWVLPNLHLSGNSLHPEKPGSSYGFSRPVSEHARIARSLGDANLRYRGENIIDHHLELPERVLEDYQSDVSDKVRKLIKSCTSFEEDEMAIMNMENRPNVYYMYTDEGIELDDGSHEKGKKKRLKSAVKKPLSAKKREEAMGKPASKEVLPEEDFPKAKGLVTKTGFR